MINWVIIKDLNFLCKMTKEEDGEPPPGDGYHVCEVKVQGLILQLSDK